MSPLTPPTKENVMNIKNKVVLVTGASAGIGLAAARLLAKNGAKLALNARSKDKLEQLSKEMPGSAAFPADMSDEFAVREMIDKIQAKFGRIDILINNAGRGMQLLAGVYRHKGIPQAVGPERGRPAGRHAGGYTGNAQARRWDDSEHKFRHRSYVRAGAERLFGHEAGSERPFPYGPRRVGKRQDNRKRCLPLCHEERFLQELGLVRAQAQNRR